MDRDFQLARNYLRMVWRFRWVALLLASFGCAGGWIYVLLMPNQFQVKAKVYIDTMSLLRPVLKGLAVDSRVQENTARVVRRTLLARPNLETVARKTDMDLSAKTPEDFEKLINGLAKRIRISGTERDNIFVISYPSADPNLAHNVVEAVLNLFVERSLGENRKDSSATRQFIERQIAEYAGRLEAAEERLKEFKQRNVGMMPGSGKDYYGRLEETQGSLRNAQLALREAESRAGALAGQIEGEEPVFGIMDTPFAQPKVTIASPFDRRIAELESQLDQLLLKFTERHPDVKSTKALLESLEQQRDGYLEEARAAYASQPRPAEEGSTVDENPVFQELKLAYGQAAAEVEALKQRVVEYERRVAELAEAVDTVPRIEAELKKLNRDYTVNRRNYEELVKRRESLKIGEDAEQTSDSVQFNIIEPPRVPLLPNGPDRVLLSVGVLIASLGMSIAVAVLLALLRPAVYSREDVEALSRRPLLGTVTRLWTPRERLRRRLEVASFAAGCVGLIAAFGGLTALYSSNVDLAEKIQALAERLV